MNKKNTILIIVTSFWAYGELLIAVEFAKRIIKNNYNIIFLIPSSHEKIIKSFGSCFKYITLIPKSRKINRLFLIDIENTYKLSFVILADFLNYSFCEVHYGLTLDDLNIFSGKIGTFDDFDWDLCNRSMDTYGFKAKNNERINTNIFEFKLLPVPIVNPDREIKNDKRINLYKLFDETKEYNELIKNEKKELLNLSNSKKTILVTSATWQEKYKDYPEVIKYVELSNNIFNKVLNKLAKYFNVIYVGLKENNNSEENITYLNQLPPDEFENYILASDLFISRNITSTTMLRIIMNNIPVLFLRNSIYFKNGTDKFSKFKFKINTEIRSEIDKLEYCYPYLMFPVGWYNFLKPVFNGNLFTKTYFTEELFNIEGIIEKVIEILCNKSTLDKLNHNLFNYKQKLDSLPDINDILNNLS